MADKGTWLFRGKLERELILERTLAGMPFLFSLISNLTTVQPTMR